MKQRARFIFSIVANSVKCHTTRHRLEVISLQCIVRPNFSRQTLFMLKIIINRSLGVTSEQICEQCNPATNCCAHIILLSPRVSAENRQSLGPYARVWSRPVLTVYGPFCPASPLFFPPSRQYDANFGRVLPVNNSSYVVFPSNIVVEINIKTFVSFWEENC